MMRSRTPHRARLLFLFALISAPICAGAQTDATPGVSLKLEYHLNALTETPAPLPEAAADAGLLLKSARTLGGASARAEAVLPAEGTLVHVLGAILLFLAANIVLLLCFSVVMRVRRERIQRRRDRFSATWEPALYARVAGEHASLPALAPSERLLFLGLWLHLLGYVRDQAADALVQAAHELDMPEYALGLLESRSPWKRVLAMRAVAAMHLKQAGDTLLAKVMEGRRRSSLTAVRALLQIDPERGFAGLEHLLRHLEWSPAAMVEIVKGGGARTVQRLASLLDSAPAALRKQIVRLIELAEDQTALPALRERLASGGDEEETAAILHCLGKLGQGVDRAAVLASLAHPNWLIRMQAVYALGAIGLEEDITRLAPLLHDRQWWVRYRAAQSLLRLAGSGALAALRDQEPDPYAREMLARALAEGR